MRIDRHANLLNRKPQNRNHQQRAEAIADEIQPDELRRLLYYLIDTVLERSETHTPSIVIPTLTREALLPITGGTQLS